MQAEKPATGILKSSDWGDTVFYYVHCECGEQDCAHNIEVEATDHRRLYVHIHHTQHTKWWEKNRWRQIWQIVTRGYAEMQTTIVLDEQTALNYSEVLKSAVNDVKQFALQQKNKKT